MPGRDAGIANGAQARAGRGGRWAIAGLLIVLGAGGLLATLVATSGAESTAAGVNSSCHEPAPGATVVRGSIGQIYVTGAVPGAHVRVTGPSGFTASSHADSHGGLLFREVPAGGPYAVSVAGDPTSPHAVRVTTPDDHPDQAFYDSQHLTFDRSGVDKTDGFLTTRDCTELSYRVQLPAGPMPKDGYPTVITYSGYAPGVRPGDPWDRLPFESFTKAGYAVVGVNMRGTGCSGGAFDFMEPIVWQDGYDVIETVAAQDWVGKVGMVDKSWPGLSQLFVASTRPPHLAAIVPGVPAVDLYRDVIYPGGIQNTGFALAWAAGRDANNAFPSRSHVVRDITDDTSTVNGSVDDASCVAHQTLRGQNRNTVQTWTAHPWYERVPTAGAPSRADTEYNRYWSERTAAVERIDVPTLLVASWQDEQVGSRSVDAMTRFAPGTHVRLVGTNGGHDAYYEGRIWHYVNEFACVYLRDDCPTSRRRYEAEEPVRILSETDPSGVPRSEFTLPKLALDGDGERWALGAQLHPDAPDDATSAASTFLFQPKASTWSQARQDRVTFTSAPLGADVVTAGSGAVDLWIAAANTDVDLQVTLSDVRPDGDEQEVQSGLLRASHRAASTAGDPATSGRRWPTHNEYTREPLVPGVPAHVRVELLPFVHSFRAGSKLRLTVSAPGAGYAWWYGSAPGGYAVTVAHDADHPSALKLPVVQSKVDVVAGRPSCTRTWSQPCRHTFP